jgi:RNA polymerase sigma-70 factor (ECF subfamily)
MGPDSEANLLVRCKRGQEDAWDQLFDLHYAPAARFVFQLGNFSWQDVEEICQEAFLSVIRNLRNFHGDSHFQTWLFRIAANKARDYRQRQNAAKRGGGQQPVSLNAEDPETNLSIDPPSTTPGPDATLISAEQGAALRRALDELEAPCREVIELRYFADLSYEDISASLGLNAKTVSSRLSRCLDRLESIARKYFSGEKTEFLPSNY